MDGTGLPRPFILGGLVSLSARFKPVRFGTSITLRFALRRWVAAEAKGGALLQDMGLAIISWSHVESCVWLPMTFRDISLFK